MTIRGQVNIAFRFGFHSEQEPYDVVSPYQQIIRQNRGDEGSYQDSHIFEPNRHICLDHEVANDNDNCLVQGGPDKAQLG
jgi:hypothetical protein